MRKFILFVSVFIVSALILAGCGGDDSGEKTTIKVGVSPGPYSVLFMDVVKPVLEDQGYTIEDVEFNDLLQADIALADGSVDLNVDQHTAYMENFNENRDADLVSLTPIPTVPAGIFPGKKTSLEDVEEGDTVGIPNDASNAARAFALMQKAEWITLDENVELMNATSEDIVDNPLNLDIVEMDSAQIPRTLSDLDYGVVPGSIVYSSNMDPSTKLLSEDILEHLELVAVTTAEHEDSEWAQDVIAAYESDEMKEYMAEHNQEDYWFIPESLR